MAEERTVEERKPLTSEERAKIREERQQRKESLAKERDTRVIFARTKDTETILNIVRSADRAINILRRNAGLRFSFEEVGKHIEKFNAAVSAMNDATKEMCEITNIPYREPRIFAKKEDSENTTAEIEV